MADDDQGRGCAICGGPEEDHGILRGYPDKHSFEPNIVASMNIGEGLGEKMLEIDPAPLMVHTVSIGNLTYSWEDYSPVIDVRRHIDRAANHAIAVFSIHDVFIHDDGRVVVSAKNYDRARRADPIRITITCKPKEDN